MIGAGGGAGAIGRRLLSLKTSRIYWLMTGKTGLASGSGALVMIMCGSEVGMGG